MTKQLVGKFPFTGGNNDSIFLAIDNAMAALKTAGLKEGQALATEMYLCDQESPHMCRIPEGKSAVLGVYIDTGFFGLGLPSVQGFVEIDDTQFTRDEIINIIQGPELAGGKMSSGDRELLRRYTERE
jgi:hypothetical protein